MRTIILKNESNTNQSNINQSKAIQQISFTWNLHQPGNTIMFFIINQAKKLLFFTRNFVSTVNLFSFNSIISI